MSIVTFSLELFYVAIIVGLLMMPILFSEVYFIYLFLAFAVMSKDFQMQMATRHSSMHTIECSWYKCRNVSFNKCNARVQYAHKRSISAHLSVCNKQVDEKFNQKL